MIRLALLLLLIAPVRAEDWRFPRCDTGNSGVTKNAGPTKPPKVLWSVEEAGGSVMGGAALAEGRLVYAVGEFSVVCRTASGGSPVWEHKTKQAVVSWPSIVGEFIFFGGQDTVHYRVRLKDKGEPQSAEAKGAITADPLVHGDLYAAGAQDGVFYGMGAESGSVRWRLEVGPVSLGAAAEGKRLFVVNQAGTLHAVESAKGKELWRQEAAAAPLAAPLATKSAALLVVEDKLLSFDAARGGPPAELPLPGIAGSPALDETVLYYGTRAGEVVSVDLKSRKELFRVSVAGEAISTPIVLAKGVVYGGARATIFAVDAKTRKLLWTHALPAPCTPPIVADRKLFVGAGNRFFCLK